jgi:hypothetical protein
LQEACIGNERLGWQLGDTILILKDNWYAPPSQELNPRITIATENALETQKVLLSRGVIISDPVERYEHSYVGSFLDSEGNKLWFCSLVNK